MPRPHILPADHARIADAARLAARIGTEIGEAARQAGLDPAAWSRLAAALPGAQPAGLLACLALPEIRRRMALGAAALAAQAVTDAETPNILAEAASAGRGAGLILRWGVAETPFGAAGIGATERGIAALAFSEDGAPEPGFVRCAAAFSAARWIRDDAWAAATLDRIFAGLSGPPEPLHLAGTPFQLAVWRLLTRIPAGLLVAYEDLARALGRPTAARAVGGAVGANPVSLLVPCHRVAQRAGHLGNYGGGPEVKALLVAAEAWLQRGGGQPRSSGTAETELKGEPSISRVDHSR